MFSLAVGFGAGFIAGEVWLARRSGKQQFERFAEVNRLINALGAERRRYMVEVPVVPDGGERIAKAIADELAKKPSGGP